MPLWIIMAGHPDVILELVIGSPFAKALLKEHFPPRYLMSGNSDGFTVSFLILAIRSVTMTSFSSPGREGRLFQEVEESSVLCLSGQLCPSLNRGVFNFPTAPGLSSSLSWLHSAGDRGAHVQPAERGYLSFCIIPHPLFRSAWIFQHTSPLATSPSTSSLPREHLLCVFQDRST